jgi:hypothetical protein
VFVDAQVSGKTIGKHADAGGKHAGDPCAEHAAAGGADHGNKAKQKGAAAADQASAKSAAPAAAASAGGGGKRQAIIVKAREYIDAIADQGGEGGKRKGWEKLKDIYDTSYNMDLFAIDAKAKSEIPKAGGKYNSWCGIFALAMAKKSGAVAREVKWVQGVGIKGLPHHNGNKGTIKPGDIIVMEMGGLWHHAVVASIDGDTFHTIDGNVTASERTQTVAEKTRQRKEISEWYETVPGE